jgi:hypothetical protein
MKEASSPSLFFSLVIFEKASGSIFQKPLRICADRSYRLAREVDGRSRVEVERDRLFPTMRRTIEEP